MLSRVLLIITLCFACGVVKIEGEIQGVVIKGLTADQDTASLRQYIVEGRLPDFDSAKYSTEVALSAKIAKSLNLSVGEDVLILFVQNPPRYRKLQIVGIYERGWKSLMRISFTVIST